MALRISESLSKCLLEVILSFNKAKIVFQKFCFFLKCYVFKKLKIILLPNKCNLKISQKEKEVLIKNVSSYFYDGIMVQSHVSVSTF